MAHLAYKRVSTKEQNTVRQLDACLEVFDRVYEDKCSGSSTDRPQLQQMRIDAMKGDTIHVHGFDRLARDTGDLSSLVTEFTSKGVTLKIHNPSLTFGGGEDNSINQLMLNILGAVSQFERSMILERQAEGIAKAKEQGKYKGAKRKADHTKVRNMVAEGIPKAQVAKKLGLSRQTVYDILKAKDKAI
tara:strand:- start:105 stop:668 length:564 start_codon:yes stop_codon:yes gene_type:complete